jgi:hypothetical protein
MTAVGRRRKAMTSSQGGGARQVSECCHFDGWGSSHEIFGLAPL